VFEWMGIIFLTNIAFIVAVVLLTHYAEKIRRPGDKRSDR
jgi:hypothetical protein